MNEKTYSYDNIDIKYILKSATADKHHLVVIFTGFAEKYSFFNVAQQFKSNVLWIQDNYQGIECYYLGKASKLDFLEAANDLIKYCLESLSLNKNQCTLLGASKGGFASLLFGVKYQYSNIISSAPISLIGSHLRNIQKHLIKEVIGDDYDNSIFEKYDNLIFDTLEQDLNLKKNIYLFLSEDDHYYIEHQAKLPRLLQKYKNFNLISISSDLVYKHSKVTSYSVPLIVSFVNSLIEGIGIQFGYAQIGRKVYIQKEKTKSDPIAFLKSVSFNNNYFYLTGDSFLKGISATNYNSYHKELILKNGKQQYSYRLGTILDPELSRKYFKDEFINYSAGGFANLRKKGIDLDDIDDGVYKLYISLTIGEIQDKKTSLKHLERVDKKHIHKDHEYRIWSLGEEVFLTKRPLIENKENQSVFFDIQLLEIRATKLYIKGFFAVLGFETENWTDVDYYLVLSNSNSNSSFRLGALHRAHLNETINNGYGIYQKSCFSTIGHKGIDLANLSIGEYKIHIIMSYKGTLVRQELSQMLCFQNKDLSFKNK